ncbi:MAG: glycosyltransferase family protein [Anaerolineales bacterium]|nr:glycosyltransferase family protein [Anaerolineales bacterium]
MKRRIVAIIQARMGSQRLPGKVLLDIHGKPMLQRVLERVAGSKLIDQIVVATTTEDGDDPIERFCQSLGHHVVRGHPSDVLDRYMQAALAEHADIIVRLTADCPLLDPGVIDMTIQALLDTDPPADLALNRIPGSRTFPIGLDAEVCTLQALRRAWEEADQPYQREHVLPYLYEVPGRFRVLQVDHVRDYGTLRWTVDTPEDLQLVRQVYADFAPDEDFSWLQVLDYFTDHPEVAALNSAVVHKGYTDVDDRMKVENSEDPA